MNFDLTRVLESKRAYRRQLAARPLREKLEMLDALRARAIDIQRAAASSHLKADAVGEAPGTYGTGGPR